MAEGEPKNGGAGSDIIQVGAVSDDVVLETLAARGEQQNVPLGDFINGVVAREVLQRGFKDGVDLVFPTAGVLMRDKDRREFCNRVGLSGQDVLDDEEALAVLRLNAKMTSGRGAGIEERLAVGDIAITRAAGFGAPYLSKAMKRDERRRYSKAAAISAYDAALMMSRGVKESIARLVGEQVPILLQRIDQVLQVMNGVLRNVKIVNHGIGLAPTSLEEIDFTRFDPTVLEGIRDGSIN